MSVSAPTSSQRAKILYFSARHNLETTIETNEQYIRLLLDANPQFHYNNNNNNNTQVMSSSVALQQQNHDRSAERRCASQSNRTQKRCCCCSQPKDWLLKLAPIYLSHPYVAVSTLCYMTAAASEIAAPSALSRNTWKQSIISAHNRTECGSNKQQAKLQIK